MEAETPAVRLEPAEPRPPPHEPQEQSAATIAHATTAQPAAAGTVQVHDSQMTGEQVGQHGLEKAQLEAAHMAAVRDLEAQIAALKHSAALEATEHSQQLEVAAEKATAATQVAVARERFTQQTAMDAMAAAHKEQIAQATQQIVKLKADAAAAAAANAFLVQDLQAQLAAAQQAHSGGASLNGAHSWGTTTPFSPSVCLSVCLSLLHSFNLYVARWPSCGTNGRTSSCRWAAAGGGGRATLRAFGRARGQRGTAGCDPDPARTPDGNRGGSTPLTP